MEIELPTEDDPRRLEVRAWFDAHPNPTPRQLVDAGYVVPHWPLPYGLDAEPELQLIIDDEMRRAGVSRPINPIGIGHCGPILVALANDEQKDKYLWPMLTGEELWCQLFSEPGAGSDLANLEHARRARRRRLHRERPEDLDIARTSAKFGILIARTDIDVAKTCGISYFIIPMDLSGHRGAAHPQHGRRRLASTKCSSPMSAFRPRTSSARRTSDGAWRRRRSPTSGCRCRPAAGCSGVTDRARDDLVALVRDHGGTAERVLRQRLVERVHRR